MDEFSGMGRVLLIAGISLAIIGLIVMFAGKIPYLGKLPGDIVIKKKDFTIYFPLATSILLSLLLSLIVFIISRFKG